MHVVERKRRIGAVNEGAAGHASHGGRLRLDRAAWLGAIGLLLAWGVWSIGWPASADGQVFLWLADLAAGRGTPYADAFETKGPAAFAPLVPLLALVGHAEPAVLRIADLVFCAVGAIACGRIAARWAGGPVSGLTALLYVAWWAGLDYAHTAQPDGWVGAAIAASVASTLHGGVVWLLLAGALIGASAMMKPFYAAFLLVPIVLVAARSGWPRRIPVLVLGAIVGAGALAVWLLALDAWSAWLACLAWTTAIYADASGALLARILPTLGGTLALPHGIAVLPAAGAVAVLLVRRERAAALAAAIWLGGALLVVLVQGRNFAYYWYPMRAPLAILAMVAFDRFLDREVPRDLRVAGQVWVALALLLALLAPVQQLRWWLLSRAGADASARYEQEQFGSFGRQPGSVLALADSLLRDGAPTDRILVWGAYPAVGPILGRAAATRFGIIRPLYEGAGSRVRDSLRTAFLDEVASAPPTWWLEPTAALPDRREEQLGWMTDSLPGLRPFLQTRYDIVERRRDWIVHRLRADGTERTVP